MPAPMYEITTGGTITTGTSAITILAAKAHANSGLLLRKYSIAFNGVTASAVPILCEIGYCTYGGTGTSTSVTPVQDTGRVLTAGFTAAKNYSAEPTTITVIKEFFLTPNGGLVIYDYPLGDEPDSALGEGFVIRLTPPAAIGVRASMTVSRC